MLFTKVRNKMKKGFTLLELLIGIAVLGVLAGVGIPLYYNYTLKGRVKDLVAAAAPAQMAITEYVQTTGNLNNYRGSTILNHPENATNTNVRSVIIVNGGDIIVRGQSNTGNTGPTTLLFHPNIQNDGMIRWECHSCIGADCLPNGENNPAPSPYAPENCH